MRRAYNLNWQSLMKFGKKHRGKTIREVYLDDPEYFKWAIDEKIDEPEIEFVKMKLEAADSNQLNLEGVWV